PLQCFGVFTGLWLATALWTGVQALNAQARADYDRASAVLSAPAGAQLVASDGGHIDQTDYVLLRRSGWPVSPILEGRLQVGGPEGVRLRVLGIEPLTLPSDVAVAGEAANNVDLDAFMGQPGQAWVAPDT